MITSASGHLTRRPLTSPSLVDLASHPPKNFLRTLMSMAKFCTLPTPLWKLIWIFKNVEILPDGWRQFKSWQKFYKRLNLVRSQMRIWGWAPLWHLQDFSDGGAPLKGYHSTLRGSRDFSPRMNRKLKMLIWIKVLDKVHCYKSSHFLAPILTFN